MDNEQTIEVPLPEGTRPNPDTVDTQEIPLISTPLPIVYEPEGELHTVVIPVPWRLIDDPIMTMEEPKLDETPLFDQLYGPPKRKPRTRRRHKMQTGDKILLGMGIASAIGMTFVYGMVAYGWGAGPVLEEEAAPRPKRTYQITITPSETSAVRQEPTSKSKPKKTPDIVAVVAPSSYEPQPTRSVVVVSSPTPSPTPTPTKTTETPSAPVTTSAAPEPTETPTSPSESPSVSATPSQSPSSPSPLLPLEPQ